MHVRFFFRSFPLSVLLFSCLVAHSEEKKGKTEACRVLLILC